MGMAWARDGMCALALTVDDQRGTNDRSENYLTQTY
jgi:hypothetical protein